MRSKIVILLLALLAVLSIAQDVPAPVPVPAPPRRLGLEAIATRSDITQIRTDQNTNIISSSNWLATPDQINWTGALAEETPETLAIRKRLLSKLFGDKVNQ